MNLKRRKRVLWTEDEDIWVVRERWVGCHVESCDLTVFSEIEAAV